MGFKNSSAYVQRKIDAILRVYRAFGRAYVDDNVVFSKTLEEHLTRLNEGLQLLESCGVLLSPKKSYFGYPTVALAFTANKLAAIANFQFSVTLKDLETYLGFTGWLRNYIAWYAQKSDALTAR